METHALQTITLTEDALDILALVRGRDIPEKIDQLIENSLILQLKECEDSLFKFESKYGMDFGHFAELWNTMPLRKRQSHNVERDYMEWEGFTQERSKLLEALRTMKTKREEACSLQSNSSLPNSQVSKPSSSPEAAGK